MIRECPSVLKFRMGASTSVSDVVAIEEPLEIRLEWPSVAQPNASKPEASPHQRSIAITMRTPGHDVELASGFLLTEGLLEDPRDILEAKHCGPHRSKDESTNILKIKISPQASTLAKLEKLNRNFYMTSSCGVCGKSSIEALKTENRIVAQLRNVTGPSVAALVFNKLPDRLRSAQSTFDQTGGLHGAALFTREGELLSSFEDVGRHNALDKLIGHEFLQGRLPLHDSILMLSGRISFELVQKAAMAGFRMIAAIGAPSSLAIELAEEMQITLVGFLRNSTFNVYTVPSRIQ